jgi:transposase
MRLRDEVGPLFRDADFAECYAVRGRPGYSPAVLMLVLVLQYVERLTDAQATASAACASTGNTRWVCGWRRRCSTAAC